MVATHRSVRGRSLGMLVLGAILALIALIPMVAGAGAQATPAASPVAAPPKLNLNLPEITITANQGFYTTLVPTSPLPPGQYIVTFENKTNARASANLVKLPAGHTVGDFTSAIPDAFGKGTGATVPDWFADATFAGGSWAAAGSTTQSVVTLSAGTWVLFSTNLLNSQSPQTIQVTAPPEAATPVASPVASPVATPVASPVASPVATQAIESQAQVTIADDSFGGLDNVSAGQQLWQVSNYGSRIHELIVYRVPDGTTADQAQPIADALFNGESPANTEVLGGSGILSPSQVSYVSLNLTPGTYLVVDTLPNAKGTLNYTTGLLVVAEAK